MDNTTPKKFNFNNSYFDLRGRNPRKFMQRHRNNMISNFNNIKENYYKDDRYKHHQNINLGIDFTSKILKTALSKGATAGKGGGNFISNWLGTTDWLRPKPKT